MKTSFSRLHDTPNTNLRTSSRVWSENGGSTIKMKLKRVLYRVTKMNREKERKKEREKQKRKKIEKDSVKTNEE